MDTNNWRPTQAGEPGIEAGDWRSQLQPDSRQRIVNKIMETLKRHLPVSGQEGLTELRKIAVRFEERIYTAAISQSDYLRKISLKMLTMENKSQPPMGTSLPSNPIVPSNKPLDSVITQGGEPRIEAGDWRSQLQPNSRQRIVNKIMATLKRHLPVSGQEGLTELAVRFEEKIYTTATSQSDYLRKISLKMLTMETKYQPPTGTSLPSNPMVPSNMPPGHIENLELEISSGDEASIITELAKLHLLYL